MRRRITLSQHITSQHSTAIAICGLFLSFILAVALLSVGGARAHADGAIPAVTVTLDPGEGTGGAISLFSRDHYYGESSNGNGVGPGQFFTMDGALWFRVPDCPDSFSAPAGYLFENWDGAFFSGSILEVSNDTTLTAHWRSDSNWSPWGSYALAPTACTLNGSGYTDIECTLTSIVLGRVDDVQALWIDFYMNGGMLSDGEGNSIPFLVDDQYHWKPESRKYQGSGRSSEGQTFVMAVYIDPDYYDSAAPGTYTGTFTYDAA